MADWIPSSILKLLALCRVWLEALVSPDAREKFHWDEALCVDATDGIEPFVAACNACAEDDSTCNRTAGNAGEGHGGHAEVCGIEHAQ